MSKSALFRFMRRVRARWHYLRGINRRYLGNRLVNSRQYRLAVDHFDLAVAFDPAFTQALYDRALLLWREMAQAKQAERDLTRVLEMEPGRSEAVFARAMARQMMGETEAALADFERYLESGDDPMWQAICRRQIAIIQESEG